MKETISIRTRLMRITLLTSGAALLLMFASYFIYEIFSYREITTGQMRILGNIVASNSSAALAFESPDDASEILSALHAEQNIEAASLYRENGDVFSVYPEQADRTQLPSGKHAPGVKFSQRYVEVFVPVMQGQKQLGMLYIRRNLNDRQERLVLYSLIAIVIIGLCILLTYFLSKRLQRGISNPIIALANASMRVSNLRDYTIRVDKRSDGEIGLLTDAFNNMLSQIEIQNKELENARETAQRQALDLEQKVLERTIEYKKQKDFAEVVVNSSLVLMAVFDTKLRILSFNRRCEEEFGVPREQALGQHLLELLPGSRNTPTHTGILRALKGEIVHNPEFRSGVTGLYYESYVIPLRNETNDVYAVLVTAHNVTQVRESAEKLKRSNAELQRKNSELEQFAYVASHDLQEPLRKIQTFIQLTRRTLHDTKAADKYMEKIETSAERMSTLIRDVLQYSRLSDVKDTFTSVDLNIILDYVKSDFELLIMQKDAAIESNKLPVVNGNKLQLHQLFANLISNAIKFSDKKPLIKISCVEASAEMINSLPELDHKQKFFEIKVSDNGIGFDQKYADKVFTIFQRLNSREQYEGTGIGLALCKRIVENHGGNISVESKLGEGTTFTILLPENE